MHSITPLFSTPIYNSTIENIDLKNLRNIAEDSDYESNNLFSITTENYLIDKFTELKKEIIKHVDTFLYDILEINEKEFFYYFPDSWFVRIKPGGSSDFHFHKNSLFSGTVYIDTIEESGDIHFLNAVSNSFFGVSYYIPYKNQNILNCDQYKIKPVTGNIILFSSHLEHSITLNQSDKTRYSLAFNIMPDRYICRVPGFRIIER